MSKQHATQSGIGTSGAVFNGSTSKFIDKTKPAPAAPPGNSAPGKEKRGQQGRG